MSWMAWTLPTALFFVTIGMALVVMTLLGAVSNFAAPGISALVDNPG